MLHSARCYIVLVPNYLCVQYGVLCKHTVISVADNTKTKYLWYFWLVQIRKSIQSYYTYHCLQWWLPCLGRRRDSGGGGKSSPVGGTGTVELSVSRCFDVESVQRLVWVVVSVLFMVSISFYQWRTTWNCNSCAEERKVIVKNRRVRCIPWQHRWYLCLTARCYLVGGNRAREHLKVHTVSSGWIPHQIWVSILHG